MKPELIHRRNELNLSQIELADAAGIPRYVIQLAEQGIRRPNEAQQLALAEALGVSVKELFPIQPTKEGSNE